jgi:hypothetical protein
MTMWASHRARAEFLRERHPFAAQPLTVYIGLLEVWEQAAELARGERPPPGQLAPWTAERVLSQVVKATEAAGPEPLATGVRELFDAGGFEEYLAGWLAGAQLPPVSQYLARACLYPPLAALGADAGAACADDPSPRGDRRCPCCGGPPQLSFRGDAQDPLVTGRRYLACARCAQSWSYSSSACPGCGETAGSKRTVYAEQRDAPVVGQGVVGCERYLIDVDLGRDTRAVPEVDELAALPLDLYATEHGLSKIIPNLMGF